MLLAGLLTVALLAAPADSLREQLSNGGEVSVVVLGDSIGAGMHLPDPETEGYPALFVAYLGRRFPTATIQLHNQSVMAMGTADFLAGFDAAVPPLEPDLVVIQLGGNDKGTGDGLDNLPAYRANLTELIHKSTALGALPAVIAPPMHEPVTGMPYPLAALEVAAAEGVPGVDADGAIKSLGADYRGLFPYFIHPREREHTAIALALDRAVATAAGYAAACDITLVEQVGEVRPGQAAQADVVVRNPSPEALTVRLASDELGFDVAELPVPAGGERAVAARFQVPLTLPAGRSQEWPVLVSAEAGGRLAFDQKRLAVCPILLAPRAGSRASEAVWATLGEAHRSVSKGRWGGPRDLSATVQGEVDAETLTLTVEVRDNDVTGGPPPLSDGLELYLDLRPDADRGRAYFTKQVALLLLPPRPASPLLSLAEDAPAPELQELPTTWQTTRRGYRVTISMPRATLDQVAGWHVTELGLDLAVDDDDGQGRKTQLLWLGRPDNYVNPRCFGQVRLDGDDPAGRLRLTIFP